jgi:hypothetical protein
MYIHFSLFCQKEMSRVDKDVKFPAGLKCMSSNHGCGSFQGEPLFSLKENCGGDELDPPPP